MRHDSASSAPPVPSESLTPSPTHAGALGAAVTRRRFLALSAGGVAALAGCARSSTPIAAATATATALPRLRAPTGVITSANASHLAQLGRLAPADGRIRGVAFSADGRFLAGGGAQFVHLWDAATGSLARTWSGHTDQIYQLAWSASTGLLASASADGTLRLWDPSQSAAVRVLGHGPSPSPVSVAWSPDGTKLLAGTLEGLAITWDAQTGHQVTRFAGPALPDANRGANPLAVYGVAWSPDGRRIATTRYDGAVFLRDASTGALLATLHTDEQPNGLAWAPDGATFASSDDKGTLQIWGAGTSHAVIELDPRDNGGWAYGLGWSPDGKLIATSRESGLVNVWSPRGSTPLATLTGHTSAAWALAWSPDNLRIATASDDTTVRLWGVV